MRKTYLLLSIIGAVVPYLFFIQFFAIEGIHLPAFVSALFANPAAGGFTADLLISSLVLWIFIFSEKRIKNPWILVVVNLFIGLSCALPLYLYLRESDS